MGILNDDLKSSPKYLSQQVVKDLLLNYISSVVLYSMLWGVVDLVRNNLDRKI